jgi:hypothetical protein
MGFDKKLAQSPNVGIDVMVRMKAHPFPKIS